MSLRLCIECGARRPRGKAPCVLCGADAPAWKRAPVTFTGLLRRVIGAVLYAGLGAIILGTAIILCSTWGFTSWLWRAIQVAIALVVGVFGGLTGLGCLYLAVETLTQRHWTHSEGGRIGSARTVFGRLMEASGRATRVEGAFAPGVPGTSALPVFSNMRIFAPRIAQPLGASMPKAVDVAITVALLGLASRGRCVLELRTTRAWEHDGGRKPRRHPEHHEILVRRADRGRALPLEHGYLENALLVALDAFGATNTAPAAAPLGPYRQGPASEVPAPMGPPIPVDFLMALLTGRRPKARSWLRATLREEAKRNPAESRLSGEQARAMAIPLAALFARQGDVFPPAAALLFQVTQGISSAERPASAGGQD